MNVCLLAFFVKGQFLFFETFKIDKKSEHKMFCLIVTKTAFGQKIPRIHL